MKRLFQNMIIAAAGVSMLTGCKSASGPITTTPSPCLVTPDRQGVAALDVDFNVPAHYMSRRNRIVITPAFMSGDSILEEYTPVVLDSRIFDKKTLRKTVLHGYVDPYALIAQRVTKPALPLTVNYDKDITIPAHHEGGRIVAVVSNDGCGQCSGIDTLDVALIHIPSTLIDVPNSVTSSWIKPEFRVREKIHSGKGEARLQFVVDKWDIVMDLANNRAELEEMVTTLGPILSDSLATINSLNIFGSASAEASYAHNVMLAKNRANSAKNWLTAQLNLPRSVQNSIRVGAAPEGWEPVVQAMIAANDPDSIKVRELMIKYPGPTDDAAEKYIRRLACWPRIRDKYLAKDRKVLYDYTWTIRNFTNDAELLEIYKTRPDAFSEDELLRVSELAADDKSRIQVYETLLRFFPESTTGINNLAALYISENQPEKVVAMFEGKENMLTPEMLNNLAVAYIKTGRTADAEKILTGLDLDQAHYNLGLLKADAREFDESFDLLRSAGDLNSALGAIAAGNYAVAAKILDDNTGDVSPRAEYARALVAANAGREDETAIHLANAVSDPALRQRAQTEPDLLRYRHSAKIQSIISK